MQDDGYFGFYYAHDGGDMTRLFIGVCLILLVAETLPAQTGAFQSNPVFTGRDMEFHVSLRGQLGHDTTHGGHGIVWPASGISSLLSRSLCFSSTPVLLGLVRDGYRVAASFQRDAFLPGPIIDGQPVANPFDARFRAYTIEEGDIAAIDYREWPAELGAPVNADGSPLFYGRKQMFWVMNDLDADALSKSTGTPPLGLEMRCLLYEPWPGMARENTLLLQVTYINQGSERIEDALLGYYMDMDVRNGTQNLAGTDSLRGMAYVYDAGLNAAGNGMPAAFGLVMLQTPVLPAPGEKARWNDGWREGYRNSPVGAAALPTKSSPAAIRDPRQGEGGDQWLALLQGRGTGGVRVLNPLTGMPSAFWVSGDPVSGTGWLPSHGIDLATGQNLGQRVSDVRVMLSSCKIDLAPGDTQQVTYAFVAARGASPAAAIADLQNRVDFLRADFLKTALATAYRDAVISLDTSPGGNTRIHANARMLGIEADMRLEISDARGALLQSIPLSRIVSGPEWSYNTVVTMPDLRREGVNASFIAEANGETLRIPGRVSIPISGSVEFEGFRMLEEGDGNNRVAPDEDAKWFPLIHNRTPFDYTIQAQSHHLPNSEWLRVPGFPAKSTLPEESGVWQWIPAWGYCSVWNPVMINTSGTMAYDYDLYDSELNVWWERASTVPTDTIAQEWYDALMTQVAGSSDERPGIRLIDKFLLQDRWYVATISGSGWERTMSLRDSLSENMYVLHYGLDQFNGAAPVSDGFRMVRGTITNYDKNRNTVTAADRFIFNPRHVLLGRSHTPSTSLAMSVPSPQPLTDWTVSYLDLPEETQLRVEVYNSIGQRIKVLRDESVQPGRHLLIWDGYWSDGRPADSGMYLLRAVTRNGEVTRKIMVLR
jgi:hypothetical protein